MASGKSKKKLLNIPLRVHITLLKILQSTLTDKKMDIKQNYIMKATDEKKNELELSA